MKRVIPVFKDDNDRIITVIMLILSIFFPCIPALVVVLLLNNNIGENSLELSKGIFNFQLLLFLISLIFAIPFFGQIIALFLAPVMAIINTLVIIITLCNLAKNQEIKIPSFYDFI